MIEEASGGGCVPRAFGLPISTEADSLDSLRDSAISTRATGGRSFDCTSCGRKTRSPATKRVAPEHLEKLRDILALLDRSRRPDDMNVPGFRLHALKGRLTGHWAVWVSGNWRVVFRFENGDAVDVDYLDYH